MAGYLCPIFSLLRVVRMNARHIAAVTRANIANMKIFFNTSAKSAAERRIVKKCKLLPL
jgi:hypothetical protein